MESPTAVEGQPQNATLRSMYLSSSFLHRAALAALLCCYLSGCSPTFDWREVRDPTDGYSVLMPGKPSTHTRPVLLNGMKLDMSMRAVEVNQLMFAIGQVHLPDSSSAAATLTIMKDQLLASSSTTSIREKLTPAADGRGSMIEVEAGGAPGAGNNGQTRVLYGRFISKDAALYQVLIVGPKNKITDEVVETFLTSFKLP